MAHMLPTRLERSLWNSAWIREELLDRSMPAYRLVPLRDLGSLTPEFLGRYLVADSRYSFFDVLPVAERAQAEIALA